MIRIRHFVDLFNCKTFPEDSGQFLFVINNHVRRLIQRSQTVVGYEDIRAAARFQYAINIVQELVARGYMFKYLRGNNEVETVILVRDVRK